MFLLGLARCNGVARCEHEHGFRVVIYELWQIIPRY
jgi:hypothetical protein